MLQINAVRQLSRTDAAISRKIDFVPLTFPGGESHVTVGQLIHEEISFIELYAHLPDGDAVMELLMATDAVRRIYPDTPLVLKMPYVPYARQDRVANPGEAHGIKVFANLINAQGYTRVVIQDPHSDVTTAVLDRVVVEDPLPKLQRAVNIIEARNNGVKPKLVSPDAGARKRTQKFAQELGLDVIFADKVRDTKTGQITGTVIQQGVISTSPLLVVDDICDGGRTFTELAKVLPRSVPKYLYVTHGIFSKGLDELLTHYDAMMTPNSWIGYEHGDGRCIRI